jgi:predicted membrane-bound spermidine synthase
VSAAAHIPTGAEPARTSGNALLVVLALLFVLSGAAGLFYEAVWSRYLSLFVGHDAYAQILTLVIYLGGMGLGALAAARRSARLRDPLFAYAAVEALIGILGLAFHDAMYLPVTGWAFERLFPALGGGTAVALAKWGLAGLLILPQSILLGATFPLMSAGVIRRLPEAPGRTLSVLYFANSLGAAGGVLVAGFVLFALAGLPGTLAAAAILNLLVALGAFVIGRKDGRTASGQEAVGSGQETVGSGQEAVGSGQEAVGSMQGPPPPAHGSLPTLLPTLLPPLLLTLAFGTAIASFIYEVGWIRMLSLVLGSSTHSFELMLSAFILGLSLGAWWMRRRADTFSDPLRALAVVQLVMGALALASLPLYLQSFSWTAVLLQAVARSQEGYALFTVARYLICLAIMLPATFCAGMTLPLMTRMLLGAGTGERAIGWIYGANTLGSIVGAALTGLVLLPVLGLRASLVAGGVLDMLLGLLALRALARAGRPAPRLVFAGTGGLALLAGFALWVLPWDQSLLASGVFRVGRIGDLSLLKMIFHRDGRTATVHVRRVARSGTKVISTNGKPDGSLSVTWTERCDTAAPRLAFGVDDETQAMLALILLAHAPGARSGAVIGHGTGMSSHLLLGSPRLERLTTIEIEPAMVAGARTFYPANRRVFDDPRSHVVIADAKSYFAAANTRYDLVLSEPSNPWVSGVSGLFTTEFYARIRRYMAPGGVFGQWLHTYELEDGLVESVLAAVHENFSDYRLYALNRADLLVVATPTGALPRPDWSVTALPDIRRDFCRFLPLTAAGLDRALVLDRAGFAPLVERGVRSNSDFYPVLDLGAERTRFLDHTATGVEGLGSGVVDFVADPALRPASWDTATSSALLAMPRVVGMLRAERMRRPGPDSAWSNGSVASQRYLRQTRARWESGNVAPESWRAWTAEFWIIRGVLHGGDAPADTGFFAGARRFAERTGAPPAVRAVVAFGEALARNDLPAAAPAAGPLLDEARQGRLWIPADDLLDGGVRALLAVHRADLARAAYDLMRPQSSRADGDLRLALLDAYIEHARAPSP